MTQLPDGTSHGLCDVHDENHAKQKVACYLFIFPDGFGLRSPVTRKNHFRQKKVYLCRSRSEFLNYS